MPNSVLMRHTWSKRFIMICENGRPVPIEVGIDHGRHAIPQLRPNGDGTASRRPACFTNRQKASRDCTPQAYDIYRTDRVDRWGQES